MNEKIKVARLSIISNTALTFGKLAIGLSMNSVSVISEAIHSGLDLIAALIAFIAVNMSSRPADKTHNYGYGKFENMASITEAALILGAAGMIILNAIHKIGGGSEISGLGLGVAVMAISACVNLFVSRKLMRVARAAESPALESDAWHLLTDVYTSLGVCAGILAIYFTGLTIIDPLIAIFVAILIVKAAFNLIRDSMRSILDARLPEKEERAIRGVLSQYTGYYVEYHQLRTRKSGSDRFIDLHLVVPEGENLGQIDSLCRLIEGDIIGQIPAVHVLIHTEPCRGDCLDKGRDCAAINCKVKYQLKSF